MKRIPILLLIIISTSGVSFKTYAQDPSWVRDNTWFFDNFTKDTLSWNLFRETFIGIAPAPSADFDQFFYSALYQTKLAAPGLCYGMDVMALLITKNGGHLGFCHPPYVYSGVGRPDDPNLETAIEITHGNQINHGFLSFMLDVIAAGKLRNGNYAFDKVVEYLAKNDPPVIAISAASGGLTGDSGHVIVPYAVQQVGSTRKIYVYDPNRSYYVNATDGRPFYDLGLNFIQIDANTGSWTYHMAGSLGDWFGDPNNGGRIVAVPLSVVGKKDRLPQSLLAEGAIAINTILIYGDVKVEQVTDHSNNHKLISDNGKDLETRNTRRLKNVLPFISYGNISTGSSRGNAYFVRGLNQLDLQIRACGEYKVGFMFNGKYTAITGVGDGSVQHLFTPSRELKYGLKKRNSTVKPINILRSTFRSNKLL